jgi:plastocyanin
MHRLEAAPVETEVAVCEMRFIAKKLPVAGVLGLAVLGLSSACGAELQVRVEDRSGAALANAVVTAKPPSGSAPALAREEIIDQINKEFVPAIKVVPVGTAIKFPNRDQIRHHVYSFSPAKTFELPLYEGTPKNDVVFDKPGLVVLGCNIHDWMRAYVYVTDAPNFAVTAGDGIARLNGLPPGEYELAIWYPRLQGTSPVHRSLSVPSAPLQLTLQMELKKAFAPRRAASVGVGGGY